MFSNLSKITLSKAAIFKNTPIYVQFYVTARCNWTCEQCNIIYANSDVRECTLDEIKEIADNFAKMGVAIILLTGGEPFMRKDLPDIIYAFESRGIHVRMQTNGFATEEQIVKAIEAGGRDISVSLDSLKPVIQDKINGGFNESWHRTLKSIAMFTRYLPKNNSFASIGCSLQPQNIKEVEDVIRFGTEISWFTSLVPVHVTDYATPKGFRSFDNTLKFRQDELKIVDEVVERVRDMRKEGYWLYDSDQYLDDIKRFIRGDKTTWRKRNNNICDTPNLYFSLLPNGEFSPCCDYRITHSYPAYDVKFPSQYRNQSLHDEVYQITSNCEGCMYGSYPEITIAMRFLRAKLQRVKTFFTSPPKKDKWPLSYEELLEITEKVSKKSHSLNSSDKCITQ